MELVRAINWNKIEDELDKIVWEKLTSQFWLDTRFPISNDVKSWNTLNEDEQLLVMRVFTGLTLLDTIQGKVGAPSLIPHALTPHEGAVYANIAFMEEVHAKSYSSIFSTLASTRQIDEAFRWSEENEALQKKAEILQRYYNDNDSQKRRITSVILESFLFYSGFYLPLYYSSKGKITNSADMIRFIIRDEAVHGFYVGQKFQKVAQGEDDERRAELKDFTMELLYELYENEMQYTEDLYDAVGWTEDL